MIAMQSICKFGKPAEWERIDRDGALLDQYAAVYREADAGDVFGVVGGEEYCGAGEIFGQAHAA